MKELEQFLVMTIKGLVRFTDKVQLSNAGAPEGKTVLFVVTCDPADLSLVIGRHGRNIRAIRDLSWSIGVKHGLKTSVIVNE